MKGGDSFVVVKSGTFYLHKFKKIVYSVAQYYFSISHQRNISERLGKEISFSQLEFHS